MQPSDFEQILKASRVSSIGSASINTLWCSKELLVEENSSRYFNFCKKYELSKIQAITYYKTKRNSVFMYMAGAIAVVLIGFALYFYSTIMGLSIFFICLSLVFIYVFISKLIEGVSCRLYLVTAVGEHELESVKTVKRAKKLLDKLSIYIGNVQGVVDDEDLKARVEELNAIVTRKPHRLNKRGW